MIGLENGLVRVIDRNTFQIVAESKLLDSPILKIEQVMQAIVIQYKDKNGSIVVAKMNKEYQLSLIFAVETMSAGFTLFASCVVYDGNADA